VEVLRPHLEFLTEHLQATVFVASLIEATGIPFPGRLVLIIAATLAADSRTLIGVGVAATVASLLGDHVPYIAGRLMGPRLLDLYCWLTLGSERCVARTLAYFQRFGGTAVLFGRFSTTVRLFASALSGCGHLSYARFLGCDVVGTVVYATLWVTAGHLFGAQVAALLGRRGAANLLVLVVPTALVLTFAYRLWRRSRYGPARAVTLGPACADLFPHPMGGAPAAPVFAGAADTDHHRGHAGATGGPTPTGRRSTTGDDARDEPAA
jgi:membrane protein DedA with SNARE-associated domain